MYIHIYLNALNVMIIAHLFLLLHVYLYIHFWFFFNREHQSLLFTSSGALNISINNQLKIIEFIVYLETIRFDKPTVII